MVIPVVGIFVSIVVAYFTATYAARREQDYGRLRLLELSRRYVINFWNAFDRESRALKRGKLDRDMYVSELEAILRQLDELVSNAYFGRLIVKYPRITMLLIQIHREQVELGAKDVLDALNPGGLAEMYRMFCALRNDLPSSYTHAEMDRIFDSNVNELKKSGAIPAD